MRICGCGNEIKEKYKRKCKQCRAPKPRICKREGCENEVAKYNRICNSCKEKDEQEKMRYCSRCGERLRTKASHICDECNSIWIFETAILPSADKMISKYELEFPTWEIDKWSLTFRMVIVESARKSQYDDCILKSKKCKVRNTKDHSISMIRLAYLFLIAYRDGRIKTHEDFKQFKKDCIILVKVPFKMNNKELKNYQSLENMPDSAKEYADKYYDIAGPLVSTEDNIEVPKEEFLKRFEQVEKWWHR